MMLNEAMKAWAFHGEKEIRLEDRQRPTPRPSENLVRIRTAGICGSDPHYHAHGRCGDFIPTWPLILGHKFAGDIVAADVGVDPTLIGTCAVHPSRACELCHSCRAGRNNLSLEMVYFGSAYVVPTSDVCFVGFVIAPVKKTWKLLDGFDYALGASHVVKIQIEIPC